MREKTSLGSSLSSTSKCNRTHRKHQGICWPFMVHQPTPPQRYILPQETSGALWSPGICSNPLGSPPLKGQPMILHPERLCTFNLSRFGETAGCRCQSGQLGLICDLWSKRCWNGGRYPCFSCGTTFRLVRCKKSRRDTTTAWEIHVMWPARRSDLEVDCFWSGRLSPAISEMPRMLAVATRHLSHLSTSLHNGCWHTNDISKVGTESQEKENVDWPWRLRQKENSSFRLAPGWWQLIHIFGIFTPGPEMIKFDVHIFFGWVGGNQPPTSAGGGERSLLEVHEFNPLICGWEPGHFTGTQKKLMISRRIAWSFNFCLGGERVSS